jgi:hypothetical protein
MDLVLKAEYLCLKTTAYKIIGMKKSPLVKFMSGLPS